MASTRAMDSSRSLRKPQIALFPALPSTRQMRLRRALKLRKDRGRPDEQDDQTDRERHRFLLGVVRVP